MSIALVSAIQSGRPWLDRFTRREYEKAFREYTGTYADLCLAEIEASRDALPALAEAVLDGLEAGRKKQRFWNRGAQSFDEKHTVVKYLTPMLLQQGEAAFSDCLHAAWCRRWPKDDYGQASFEELRDGFQNVILGITFKEKK